MKDECAEIPIAEWVCLRPKMYSIVEADEKKIKKANVANKKSVVKKQIMHEETLWYEAVMAWNEHSLKRGP